MPFTKNDVIRAIEVLEWLAEELRTPADAHHRLAVVSMLRVLKTQLFSALVDIYEDYEGTIQEAAPPPPPPNLEEIFGMLKIQPRVRQDHGQSISLEGSVTSPAQSHRDVGVSPFSTPPGSVSEFFQPTIDVLPPQDQEVHLTLQTPRPAISDSHDSGHVYGHSHTSVANKRQNGHSRANTLNSATLPHPGQQSSVHQEFGSPFGARVLDAATSLPDISMNRNGHSHMDSPVLSMGHRSTKKSHTRSGSRSSNTHSDHDSRLSSEDYVTHDDATVYFKDEDYYSSDNHLDGSYDGDIRKVTWNKANVGFSAHAASGSDPVNSVIPEDRRLRWEDYRDLGAQVSGGESVGILNRLLASSATELASPTDVKTGSTQSTQKHAREERQEDEGFYSPSHRSKDHSRSKMYLPSEPRMVELFKGDQGFGFSLVGSTETGSYVTGILPGGPCDGVLYRGDQIIMVNNMKIDRMSYVKTAQLFKSIPAASSVMLMVKHNRKGLEELEAVLSD
ncbi:uncharacterized protein LOC106171195 [Lingula anatina]|uniref:Uncharacterized protein LOC106171195 n=1 Tax=Lingula anatina TaxID=7574 RepID=A0A1S3J979_LINAN|nr:uncharacterized protein LOC106171195 [Lingula anatina]|eukprot:XP_013406868.1 uncharacterized protein LOC106171195 [Lingula anatina]